MNNSFVEFKDAMSNMGVACCKAVKAFKEIMRGLSRITNLSIKIYMKPNSRIKHLALYSKKKRIQKKNIKRLLRGA